MGWFREYWWLIVLLLLGIILNGIRDLGKVSYKRYLDKKNGMPAESSKTDTDKSKH